MLVDARIDSVEVDIPRVKGALQVMRGSKARLLWRPLRIPSRGWLCSHGQRVCIQPASAGPLRPVAEFMRRIAWKTYCLCVACDILKLKTMLVSHRALPSWDMSTTVRTYLAAQTGLPGGRMAAAGTIGFPCCRS
jgi:hypothetical protein